MQMDKAWGRLSIPERAPNPPTSYPEGVAMRKEPRARLRTVSQLDADAVMTDQNAEPFKSSSQFLELLVTVSRSPPTNTHNKNVQ